MFHAILVPLFLDQILVGLLGYLRRLNNEGNSGSSIKANNKDCIYGAKSRIPVLVYTDIIFQSPNIRILFASGRKQALETNHPANGCLLV